MTALTRTMTVVACVLLAACDPPAEPTDDAPGGGDAGEPTAAASSSEDTAGTTAAPSEREPASGLTPAPAPPGASVYFVEPADGANVSSPVRVVFGLTGAGVAPAGIDQEGTGHHHLLIDTEIPPAGQPIPDNETHRHFGAGQTETEVVLSPGSHTLQLLFADHLHVPHDPPVASEQVTINVE